MVSALAEKFNRLLFSPSVFDGIRDKGLLNPRERQALFEPGGMVTAVVSAVHVHPRTVAARLRVGWVP